MENNIKWTETFDKTTYHHCGKGWGCDNCGACYDNCIDKEEAKSFCEFLIKKILDDVENAFSGEELLYGEFIKIKEKYGK